MLTPLAAVSGLLGDTLIDEEYKGDYARARDAASRAADDAARGGSPAAIAESLVQLALVQTLQGDCVEAAHSCARARQQAGNRGAVALWIAAIEMLATIWRFNR